MSGDPEFIHPRSYVKVTPVRGGHAWAVETFDYRGGGVWGMRGRHYDGSEGLAVLHAQRFVASGYTLVVTGASK